MAHFSILDSEEAKNIAVVHKTNQGDWLAPKTGLLLRV